MYKPLLLLIMVCCLLVNTGFAQLSSAVRHRDSLQNSMLMRQSIKLQQIASGSQSDSVKKIVLQQLQTVSLKDTAKTRELVNTLRVLRLADSVRLKNISHQLDSLKHSVSGFAVAPFGKPLFLIYSPLGAFSPQDRADAIARNIKQLTHDYVFKSDSLSIITNTLLVQIQYAHQPVLSIDTTDALWMMQSKSRLAQYYRNQIAVAMASHQEDTSLQAVLREAGLALLVILVVAALIYFIKKLFRNISSKIRHQRGKRINGIRIRNYELFNAGRQIGVLLFLNNLLMWALIILLVYLALPVLFGIFPWTKGIANLLFGYFLNPAKKIVHSIWNYLPNLFTVIMIAAVFWYLLKGIRYLKSEIEKGNLTIPGFYVDWAAPTYQIIRVIVLAFMLILIFPYLPGSNSLAFKGVSVFLGVLFTFGSAGPLGNIISGLVLTYMRSFKVGDRIKIGEVTGDVMEETLLVIRIKTIKNEVISIPNSTVLGSPTINYSSESTRDGLIINTTITMGYNTPWQQVHQLMIAAAMETEFIEPEPKPYVLQTSLDNYYVTYQINAYTRVPNKQAVIYSTLHQHIQDQFTNAGIKLLSPQYRVINVEQGMGEPYKGDNTGS